MPSRNGALALAAIDFLICLVVVLRVLIAPPPVPASAIDSEGVYVVRVSWPDGRNDDVDTYVETPSGKIVYFNNLHADGVHLAFDDQGVLNDEGRKQNQERATLRSVYAGWYTVNVHMFAGGSSPVRVVLYKLKGADGVVVRRSLVLRRNGDEQTAFRFRVDGSGDVAETNTLPKSLVG